MNIHQPTHFLDVWNQFVSGGDPTQIPVNIRNSWERCRKANVNPKKEVTIMGIDQHAVRKRMEHRPDLYQILKSHHSQIERYFDFLPVGIVFADTEGFILSIEGDNALVRKMEDTLQVSPIGGSIKENIVGTTAPGVCIEEKCFSSITAEEHYVQSLHWCSCIAAPVYDWKHHLIGALNFTVRASHTQKLIHLIPVLLDTAKSIQLELSLKQKLEQFGLFESYFHSTFDFSGSIMILVDRQAKIIELNSRAKDFFNCSFDQVRNQDIRQILASSSYMGTLFKDTGGRMSFTYNGTPFLAESIPIFNSMGDTTAYLLKLKEKTAKKIIQDSLHNKARFTFDSIVGTTRAIKTVIERAKMAAKGNSTILIEGETGTGKELFAHAVHNHSPRAQGPFIAINCAAIPKELTESELFGYEKGAYTGARAKGNAGKFEMADNGTIFLDEIHTMDLSVQNKILRVMDDKQITRIGGDHSIPLNTRIITASSTCLKKQVEKGEFIEALFYRLNVVKLCLPNLKERKEDIPALATHLIHEMNAAFGRSIKKVSDNALHKLSQYSWPGNVRELKNCMENAFNFCTTDILCTSDFADTIPNDISILNDKDQTIDIMTRELICRALETNRTVKEAAQSSGIPVRTFYRKMKTFGIHKP